MACPQEAAEEAKGGQRDLKLSGAGAGAGGRWGRPQEEECEEPQKDRGTFGGWPETSGNRHFRQS